MNSGIVSLVTTMFVAGLVSGCASQAGPGGRPDGPPPGGAGAMRMNDMPTGFVARPVALLLTSMDRDGDALVSSEEFEAGLSASWDALNMNQTDRVGALVFAQWAEITLGSSDALPSRLSFDTNLDGIIDPTEFRSGLEREFEQLDANHDGILTRSELVIRLPERQFQQGGQGGGGSRGPGGGGGDRPPPPGGRG
ncbi:hypothetical protein [Ponticaulis sp.]|uniref:EF-hand domain-containing protein n=1 Tax=Ponticaulis sp. TaxID=2020902 RepID=UPI0025F22ADC|nr:hypothetical protein [Ponticaulis sp.]